MIATTSIRRRQTLCPKAEVTFKKSATLKESVEAVQSRHAVGFGHGWVVESRIDEVVECIVWRWLLHDGLSDMDDFGSVWTETVHA